MSCQKSLSTWWWLSPTVLQASLLDFSMDSDTEHWSLSNGLSGALGTLPHHPLAHPTSLNELSCSLSLLPLSPYQASDLRLFCKRQYRVSG